MDKLQIFEDNKFGKIEIYIDENKKEWFPATEIAEILGYSNPQKAIRDHCKEAGCTNRSVSYPSGAKFLKYIDEGNLYRLIVRSKLPDAEKFESWIMDEVLPSIRKTGQYKINKSDRPLTSKELELRIRYYNSQSKMVNCISNLIYNSSLDEDTRDRLIEKSAKLLLDDTVISNKYSSTDDIVISNHLEEYLRNHDIEKIPFAEFYDDFITTYDLKVSKVKVGIEIKKLGYYSKTKRIKNTHCKVIYRV